MTQPPGTPATARGASGHRASATTLPMTMVPGDSASRRRGQPARGCPSRRSVRAATRPARWRPASTAASRPRRAPRRSRSRRSVPIRTTSVAAPGAIEPTTLAKRSASCPVVTRTAPLTPRCVTGIDAAAGAAKADDTPGHDLERHAGGLERERFFAAAAEHERIAALEAHDAPAAPRGADQRADDRVLPHRLGAASTADEDPLRALGQRDCGGRHQRVVEHEIGFGEPARRPARQQLGIAGTGADQRDEAPRARRGAGCGRSTAAAVASRGLRVQLARAVEQAHRGGPPSARARDASRRAAASRAPSSPRRREPISAPAPRAARAPAPAPRRRLTSPR